MRKNSTTKFKGVVFVKGNQKFRVRIMINNKYKHIGYFTDPLMAAKKYDQYAKHYYGEFALTNF